MKKLTVEQYESLAVPVFKICSELADSPRVDIPELARIHNIIDIITSFKPDELTAQSSEQTADTTNQN
ncbi:hypothetical protein E4T81_12265 [Barnesiella sp. WM24]|uniref:hypothetical protein n=1 Tax=Barnesiella sp. WM24 TaxID=2558278 RepID=UPI0010726BA5|nr:hypothetical protein [Barnesiella sp. WM24]TFU92356.1 hypothetical protein E4T81_12265 [Barnesiella sp. WM24]